MDARSEREKMLAGQTYNCMDESLAVEREETKKLLRMYNLAEDARERRAILHRLVGALGAGSIIESPFYCTYGRNIDVGRHVYMNFACTILDNGGVCIGDHVMFGPNVQVYTAAHHLQAKPRNEGLEVAKPITIRDNVWVGGGAILLPGVTIGTNSVVGAGAVVTGDVPANTVVAGNPARVIREIST